MFTNESKGLREATRVFGCSRTGSTGEVNERIGLALCARRRQDHDIQTNHPAFFGRAILVNFERPAFGRTRNSLNLTVHKEDGFARTLMDPAGRVK
jgi:hypothetical protein